MEPVTKFLKGFLSRQFIETFNRAQVEALVSRWVPFCGWTYPRSLHGGNYDSIKFKTFVVSVTFAAILEDLFELNTNKSFGDPEKMKKLIAAVSDILQESVNPEEKYEEKFLF